MIKAHLENGARVWVPDYKENVDAMECVQDEGDQDAEFTVCLATPSREEKRKKHGALGQRKCDCSLPLTEEQTYSLKI